MDSTHILEAKHGFILGSEGGGKSTFIRKKIEESNRLCAYITVHNEDFGDQICITINEPSEELKDLAISQIREELQKGTISFVIKVDFGRTGQVLGIEYLNDVLIEFLYNNKKYTIVLDDAQSMTRSTKKTYQRLLEQNAFSVVSVLQYIDDESRYVLDYAAQVCIFKISPSVIPYLEEKGLLVKNDTRVFDLKPGEFIKAHIS